MPNLSNYPTWFSMYAPPIKPTKPKAKVSHPETLDTLTTYDGSAFNVDVIPKGTDFIRVHNNDNYGSSEVVVTFLKERMVVNPVYEKQLTHYQQLYKEYKERLPLWKELKAKYEQETKDETEALELAMLKRLKTKYGE